MEGGVGAGYCSERARSSVKPGLLPCEPRRRSVLFPMGYDIGTRIPWCLCLSFPVFVSPLVYVRISC